jgi:hypothetical protein
MKSYKPYLSLSKSVENYVLDVVFSASKLQTIASIQQQEIVVEGKAYWGVIITLSTTSQIVNGPDVPIFSTTADISFDKAGEYKTIKCVVRQVVPDGEVGPARDKETDVDFIDGD